MPTIKFSHKYTKLISFHENISKAKLLEVLIVNLEDLSKPFLDYDTDNGKFQLPKKGKYMLLIFQKYRMSHLFTTIRRWTEEKELYYKKNIGQVFNVEYLQEGNK